MRIVFYKYLGKIFIDIYRYREEEKEKKCKVANASYL